MKDATLSNVVTRVDVFRNGVLWLLAQNVAKPAMWARVKDSAASGDTLKITPHKNPPPPPPPPGNLEAARGRIFLAQEPLAALQAPSWMVPVCTADPSYRGWYTSDTIRQLRARFGRVEAWCDCHTTFYPAALAMARLFALDGAWGECESQAAFDSGYADGARRFVGSVDASVFDDARLAKVKSGEVLLTVELYRNKEPNKQPDWRGANAGIGGNTIACYGSDTEGAVYTPVSSYRQAGLYVPHNDSVYGVGLQPADWQNLY